MPRWPWKSDGNREAAPAEAPPAEAVVPSTPAADSSAEVVSPAELPAAPAIAREIALPTPTLAPAATELPAEPRGLELGGELERALAKNEDGGISSMSLVGAQGGLHQTAWIFAEAERMASTNESEAIAQRVVDSMATPLSFEPEAFYDSLASLTSYREQGGFDSSEPVSSSSAFSSLSEATNTYPPFGSPQTRGAGSNSPAFDSAPARRTVERAVDAKFSNQTAPPPASSGLVYAGGSFSAPEPVARPAPPRAVARWAADAPTAPPAVASEPVAQPPIQRLADRAGSPQSEQAPSPSAESVRPTRGPVDAASAQADLSLAMPTAPWPAAAEQPQSSAGVSSSPSGPVQRSPEASASAAGSPIAGSPAAVRPAAPVDDAPPSPATEASHPRTESQSEHREIARTFAESPTLGNVDPAAMPFATARPPAAGTTTTDAGTGGHAALPDAPQRAAPGPEPVQRTPDALAGEANSTVIAGAPMEPSAPAAGASAPVSPNLPVASAPTGPDLPLAPVAPVGAAGTPPDAISRHVAVEGSAPTASSAPPAPAALPADATAPPPSSPNPTLGSEGSTTLPPTAASSGGTSAESPHPAQDLASPGLAGLDEPGERPAAVSRTFADAPAPPERLALEMTLAGPAVPADSLPPSGAESVAAAERSTAASPLPEPPPRTLPAVSPSAATVTTNPPGATSAASAPAAADQQVARTAAASPSQPPTAAPELTLHRTQTAAVPGTPLAAIRRRFDPLRFLRRSAAPAETSTEPAGEPAQRNLATYDESSAARSGTVREGVVPASATPAPAPLVSREPALPAEPPEMTLATSATELRAPPSDAEEAEPIQGTAAALAFAETAIEANATLPAAPVSAALVARHPESPGEAAEMPLAPGSTTTREPVTSPPEQAQIGPNGPAIGRGVAAPPVAPPTQSPQVGGPDIRAAQASAVSQPGDAGRPEGAELTLQRSPAAAPAVGPIDAAETLSRFPAAQSSVASAAQSAPPAPELTLPRRDTPTTADVQASSIPGSEAFAAAPFAPAADSPPPVIARSEAAADFADLDLVAPPHPGDAVGAASAVAAAGAGPPAFAQPVTLDLAPAAAAASAPSERLGRAVDTSPQRSVSPAAGDVSAMPAVPASAGPSVAAAPVSLDLASPLAAPNSTGAAPGDSIERAIQRATASTVPDAAVEPTGSTVMASSGGTTLGTEPPRLDLVSPATPREATSPPAGGRTSAAGQPVSGAPGDAQQGSSPMPAIARSAAIPSPSSAPSDLTLSASVSAGPSGDVASPEASAIARATAFVPSDGQRTAGSAANFEFAGPGEPARRSTVVNRSVAGGPYSNAAAGPGASIERPLFSPPSPGIPDASSSPAIVERYVASSESRPQQEAARSRDMPLSIEPSADGLQREATSDASGSITSVQHGDDVPAESPPISDANLEQITEHVWQFVRRELRVERERQRGQA